MLNHTKGEWKATYFGIAGLSVLTNDHVIAKVCIEGNEVDTAVANALLISQSPAMYEALKAGVDGLKLNPKGEGRELAIKAFLFLAEKVLSKLEEDK